MEANLSELGVERIDVIDMRRLTGPPGLTAEGDQVVALDDQLAELAALRDEGKIGAIGLSCVTPEQLRAALSVGIACVQNAYNLIQRDDEPSSSSAANSRSPGSRSSRSARRSTSCRRSPTGPPSDRLPSRWT